MELEDSKQRTVLLVDDNPDIQTVISISLEHFGYIVRSFATGQAAIDALDEVQPGIAIIDYGLPDMTGIEVGEAIRKWRSGGLVKLILFSGTSDARLKQQADAAGFASCLTKPIRMAVLRELIENLVR